MSLLLVALGGALGAVLRYLVGQYVFPRTGGGFPWAVFVINVTGSLLIGLVFGLAARGRIGPGGLLFLATGVLGGYTTFSTFSLEAFTLLREGRAAAFALYTGGQVALGLVAAWAGMRLADLAP